MIHADIFFFVTTIAVGVFAVVMLVGGYYIIGALRNFRDMSRTLKARVERASEDIEHIAHDVAESRIFRFVFGGKKKKANK